MVCGFLGTLIGIERASALRRWWTYPGPIFTAAGGLLLAGGALGSPAPIAFVLGSACLLAIVTGYLTRWPSMHLFIMACGSAAWLVGNLLWLMHWPIHRMVVWWMAFLLMTIVSERFELNRFLKPSRLQHWLLFVAVATFLFGVIVSWPQQLLGERIAGIGMFALAFWLQRNDIAQRNIRKPGLPRFTAVCLLSGYVWLAIAGLGLLFHAPLPKYGFTYDSVLHAFFNGFVFAMIFGHAPVVIPAVFKVAVPFRRFFYVHVVLMQVSFFVRIVGDIIESPLVHRCGGLFNAASIILFVASTAFTAVMSWRMGVSGSNPSESNPEG